jgi:hypothetical protein
MTTSGLVKRFLLEILEILETAEGLPEMDWRSRRQVRRDEPDPDLRAATPSGGLAGDQRGSGSARLLAGVSARAATAAPGMRAGARPGTERRIR